MLLRDAAIHLFRLSRGINFSGFCYFCCCRPPLNETKIVLATFSVNIARDHTLMKVTAVLTCHPSKQPRGVDGTLLGSFSQEQLVPE